jgi:thiol:disulfide interchange protein DsbC
MTLRKPTIRMMLRLAFAGAAVFAAGLSIADEAAIRKNLPERLPQFPRIDEVTRTPIPGIWEVRSGTDILYTDEQGNYVIEGSIHDTRSKMNLTEARINKLTAIDFASLPLKDAIAIKQGNGSRKLVVFADPNCGYCKRLERDLLAVKDVTIYTFLYPILGPDSVEKSKAIWCAKDPQKAWRDWMVEGNAPSAVTGACDLSALERNAALGRGHKVQGTPALVFKDGQRVPGAMPAAAIEKRLSDV